MNKEQMRAQAYELLAAAARMTKIADGLLHAAGQPTEQPPPTVRASLSKVRQMPSLMARGA